MIFRLMRCCCVILLAAGLGGPQAVAQVPRVITYQGALDAADGPLPDRVKLRFAFYPSQQPQPDEAPLAGWTETHAAVPVEEGRVSVLLGGVNPLPDAVFEREDVFLEVRVDDDPLSRFRMASAPFARRAARAEVAEQVASGGVPTEALADGAVARPKIRAQAVGADQLADGAVTRAKIADAAVRREHLAADAAVHRIHGPRGTSVSGDVTLQAAGDAEIDVDEATGTITISADGGWFGRQRSARRFKTDVRDLEAPLDLVAQLRGVRFAWKEDGRADVGVIAEEVAEVLPELVTFEADGRARGVRYAKLTAVLVEAIKAQQAALDRAHTRIDTLEDRLARLERRRR